ncbi:hypothetical protein P7K49_006644, partial [Saguinus oedipus]
ELQGNADSNAEKNSLSARGAERSSARRGGPGEPVCWGAAAGELRRARAAGPGQRREAAAGCRMLLERFA